MLHNALSSLSTDPDQLVHEQKTNIRGGRSSTTSLCTCTSEQLPDQTSSCRFSAQIQTQFVQQIAINFDFVLNCKFFVMQAVHCGIIQSSRQTLQLNIDNSVEQRMRWSQCKRSQQCEVHECSTCQSAVRLAWDT